jgi:hypothetical protein
MAAPALLTFDHHTDTHLAFLHYHYNRGGGMANVPFSQLTKEANIACSNINSISDIENAVALLRNDEQIDFSIRCGIISHAYVISHSTNPQFVMHSEEYKVWFSEKLEPENLIRGIIPPREADRNYNMPSDKIISLGNDHFYDMGVRSEKERIDLSLDDSNLSIRMNEISRINESIFTIEYDMSDYFILDVDLDYFNTRESISPQNISVFYELIRGSQIITIATEDWFVNDCKLEGESLNVQYLLEKLLWHIEQATA